MISLKEYFKQRLLEDLATPELVDYYSNSVLGNPETAGLSKKEKNMKRHYRLERRAVMASPHLFTLNKETGKPERVVGASLSPELHTALRAAISSDRYDHRPMSPEHKKLIKDFVTQYGPFDFTTGTGVAERGRERAYPIEYGRVDARGKIPSRSNI